MDKSNFHTLKGYQLLENTEITSANEEYLEMICRIYKTKNVVRVSEIANKLNVKQSSVSKMLDNLKLLQLIEYEKYGYVKPTEKGISLGEYLLYRHAILNEFLCYINNSYNEIEQVEKIEHFLDRRTIENIKEFLEKIKSKDL